jgi:hypothetical protein
MSTVVIGTRVEPDLLEALDFACKVAKRRRADAVRLAIEDWIEGVLVGQEEERPAGDGAPENETIGRIAGGAT